MTPSNTDWSRITQANIAINCTNNDILFFEDLGTKIHWDICPNRVLKTLGHIPSNFPGNLLQDSTHSHWTWCGGNVGESGC